MRQLKKKFFHLPVLMVAVALTGFVAVADTVDNPGDVTVTAEANSFIQIRSTQVSFGGSTPPSVLGGMVDADGNLTFPADQASFQPVTIMIGGFSVTGRLVVTQDGSGSINPLTGNASATLTLRVAISGPFLPAGCQIPATTVNLDTGNDGGVAYDATTGTATVVDNSFAAPASTGCGLLGGVIDSQIGLPSPSGNNVIKLNVRLSPILTGS